MKSADLFRYTNFSQNVFRYTSIGYSNELGTSV